MTAPRPDLPATGWRRFTPLARRRTLALFAGIMWALVALMLLGRSVVWLAGASLPAALLSAGLGIGMGLWLVPRAFRPLVEKNIARWQRRPEPTCLFSCFAWRSWAIVAVMVAAGITLRRSPVPRPVLIVPYLGMAICLGAGAWRYLRHALGGHS